jgi:hypothetical protein
MFGAFFRTLKPMYRMRVIHHSRPSSCGTIAVCVQIDGGVSSSRPLLLLVKADAVQQVFKARV